MHVYDYRRPWQDQIDWDLVKAMLEEQVPEALEKLGFERLCTVTRMIKEYSEGNLTLDELTRLVIHYDFGLIDIPTTLVGDITLGPDEGEVSDEISLGVFSKQLSCDDYGHIYWAQMAE